MCRACYQKYCLPWLINAACSTGAISDLRATTLPLAAGAVLEVGMGSACNIPFYKAEKVKKLWAVEPSSGLRQLAKKKIQKADFAIEILPITIEQIVLPDHSIDTIVLTFSLCSIGDWASALQQMRRVLKPGGRLLFCEHGLAEEQNVRRWQNLLNPVWYQIAGGCHLNRPISKLIRYGGFQIKQLNTGYIKGSPKFSGFYYQGVAV